MLFRKNFVGLFGILDKQNVNEASVSLPAVGSLERLGQVFRANVSKTPIPVAIIVYPC